MSSLLDELQNMSSSYGKKPQYGLGAYNVGDMGMSGSLGSGDSLNFDGVYQNPALKNLFGGQSSEGLGMMQNADLGEYALPEMPSQFSFGEATQAPPSFLDKLSGYAPIVNAAANAFQAYGNYKQLGHAKKMLSESKRQFNLNYDSQKKLTNGQLRDRQKARYASNQNAYESPSSYMEKNRIG